MAETIFRGSWANEAHRRQLRAWHSDLSPDGVLVVRLSIKLPEWDFIGQGTPTRHVLTAGPGLFRCFKRAIERAMLG